MTIKDLLSKINSNDSFITELISDKKKLILVAISMGIFLFIDLGMIFPAQIKGLKNIGKDISIKAEEIKSVKLGLSQAKNTQIKTEAVLVKRVISESEIMILLQRISEIANERNISLAQIKPLKNKSLKDEVVEGQSFSPFSVSLEFDTDYHNFGVFLNKLEQMDILSGVSDLHIINSNDSYLKQSFIVTLKAYVKK